MTEHAGFTEHLLCPACGTDLFDLCGHSCAFDVPNRLTIETQSHAEVRRLEPLEEPEQLLLTERLEQLRAETFVERWVEDDQPQQETLRRWKIEIFVNQNGDWVVDIRDNSCVSRGWRDMSLAIATSFWEAVVSALHEVESKRARHATPA